MGRRGRATKSFTQHLLRRLQTFRTPNIPKFGMFGMGVGGGHWRASKTRSPSLRDKGKKDHLRTPLCFLEGAAWNFSWLTPFCSHPNSATNSSNTVVKRALSWQPANIHIPTLPSFWELKSSYWYRLEGIFSKMFGPRSQYDLPGRISRSRSGQRSLSGVEKLTRSS